MSHVKNIKVSNPKNVVVQIPGFLSCAKWGLVRGDEVEVHIGDDGESIILRPKKTFRGSNTSKEGERLVRTST